MFQMSSLALRRENLHLFFAFYSGFETVLLKYVTKLVFLFSRLFLVYFGQSPNRLWLQDIIFSIICLMSTTIVHWLTDRRK